MTDDQTNVDLGLMRKRLKDLDELADRSLSANPPGGPTGGMDSIWAKLAEHDKAFGRIETTLSGLSAELSNAKFWYVGTTAALVLAGLALVYAALQDTKATMSTALSAIQTIVAERPPASAVPAPPTVIVVPSHVRPITPSR